MTIAESDKNAFKQMIVKNIAQNEAVLSQGIDTESDAIELLEDIITLQVTIRGILLLPLGWKSTRQQQKIPQRKIQAFTKLFKSYELHVKIVHHDHLLKVFIMIVCVLVMVSSISTLSGNS